MLIAFRLRIGAGVKVFGSTCERSARHNLGTPPSTLLSRWVSVCKLYWFLQSRKLCKYNIVEAGAFIAPRHTQCQWLQNLRLLLTIFGKPIELSSFTSRTFHLQVHQSSRKCIFWFSSPRKPNKDSPKRQHVILSHSLLSKGDFNRRNTCLIFTPTVECRWRWSVARDLQEGFLMFGYSPQLYKDIAWGNKIVF